MLKDVEVENGNGQSRYCIISVSRHAWIDHEMKFFLFSGFWSLMFVLRLVNLILNWSHSVVGLVELFDILASYLEHIKYLLGLPELLDDWRSSIAHKVVLSGVSSHSVVSQSALDASMFSSAHL